MNKVGFLDKCQIVQVGKNDFKIVNLGFDKVALCVGGRFKFKSEKEARRFWEDSGFGIHFDMVLIDKLYIE